jgi:hypothetical protein
MATGVFTNTRTKWGWACSVASGTGPSTAVIQAKGNPVSLKGVFMTAAATSDIFTLTDANDVIILKVAGGTLSDDPKSIPLWGARFDGLKISHVGVSSTGLMSVFTD